MMKHSIAIPSIPRYNFLRISFKEGEANVSGDRRLSPIYCPGQNPGSDSVELRFPYHLRRDAFQMARNKSGSTRNKDRKRALLARMASMSMNKVAAIKKRQPLAADSIAFITSTHAALFLFYAATSADKTGEIEISISANTMLRLTIIAFSYNNWMNIPNSGS
ncbi:hypothetical protein [Paenibacillus thiaminolyticus]|uniref:hypothetical protein n=1 Tax=Paenibacillus thiaminolyticus TaxID=49283 RepID=UPI002542D1CD|nr:hypothetical protein [Paenibacillus thiaminolyticus]WII35974.1 hypothetical protein O0V01_20110 [Paenibacillus thiaminolyticus]